MFSYPRPGIDPAYYQADAQPPWELTREAPEERERSAAARSRGPSEHKCASSDESKARNSTARSPVESSYTELVVDALREQIRSGEIPHPPTQAPRTRLKHVKRVVDRRGVVRIYYVRGPKPHIRLPDLEGTPSFMSAYEVARREKWPWRLRQQPAKPRRSVKDLVDLYRRGSEYGQLMPDTRRVYERVLRRLLQHEDFATYNVAMLDRRHVQGLVDSHAGTPAGAADLLKKLRALMRCAIAHGWRSDDPTRGIKPGLSQRTASSIT